MRRWDRARKSARGNRLGLAVLGVLLLAAGATAIAAGAGLFGAGLAVEPVLGTAAARFLRQGWVAYAAAAAAVVLALVALRWLLAQGRSDAVGRLRLEPDPRYGVTEMSTGTARGVFEEEVAGYPGVYRARAQVTESSREPRLCVYLTLGADADAAAVWRRVRAEALEDLRGALELERFPAVIRMVMTSPPKNPGRELA